MSQTQNYSLSKAVVFSLLLHASLFLILVLCDFIPIWNSKPKTLSFKGLHVGPTMSMKPSQKPMGVERKLDVTNPSPPSPPKPKPLPTPETKPKPETMKRALRPIPTPKTTTQTALPPPKTVHKRPIRQSKKVLATPPPEPPEMPKEAADAAPPKPPDDLPAIPPSNYNGPKIEAKGSPDGGDVGGLPIQTDEGVNLPPEYLIEAYRRINSNFIYPSTVDRRYPNQQVITVVEFRVALDGTISDIRVRQSCGDAAVDAYATRCIEKTASFPPLKDLIKTGFGKNYVTASVPFSFGGQGQ